MKLYQIYYGSQAGCSHGWSCGEGTEPAERFKGVWGNGIRGIVGMGLLTDLGGSLVVFLVKWSRIGGGHPQSHTAIAAAIAAGSVRDTAPLSFAVSSERAHSPTMAAGQPHLSRGHRAG